MSKDVNCRAEELQNQYCKISGLPNFSPYHGICDWCGRNIYKDYPESRGYSMEYASGNLISGCPHCHRTFVD